MTKVLLMLVIFQLNTGEVVGQKVVPTDTLNECEARAFDVAARVRGQQPGFQSSLFCIAPGYATEFIISVR